MAKRKTIRAYARHKKCGIVLEPFDFDVNIDTSISFESDGTSILERTGQVPRLAEAKEQRNTVYHMLKQAARQTKCLHCNENVVLTSDDVVILDYVVREVPTKNFKKAAV